MAMRSASRAFRFVGVVLVAGLSIPACRSSETPSDSPESQAGGEGASEESIDSAAAASETLAQRRQSLSKTYFESGQAHFDQGRLEEARRDFARVLEMDPSNAEAQALFDRTNSLLGYRAGERAEVFASARDRDMVRIQVARFRDDSLITQGRY
jgi:tetratricopeptide (TPR) repeat protein